MESRLILISYIVYHLYHRLLHISPKVSYTAGIEVQSSAVDNQSYVHHPDAKPLLYRNIGQHLRLAAENYPNHEALVSCLEAKRFSFSDVLDKVSHQSLCDVDKTNFEFTFRLIASPVVFICLVWKKVIALGFGLQIARLTI